MSQLLNSRQVSELALRRIGAFAISDSAADPNELSVSCGALDRLVSEKCAVMRCWPFVRINKRFLLPQTPSFDLYDQAGSVIPLGTFQYFVSATVRTVADAANEQPLRPIILAEYEDIENKVTTGTPEVIYVSRETPRPTIYLHPVPGNALHQLDLTFQAPSADMSATTGSIAHGLEASWQRWMEYQLSVDVGSGPVRSLPKSELDVWQAQADRSWADLEFYNAHQKRSRFTKFRNF